MIFTFDQSPLGELCPLPYFPFTSISGPVDTTNLHASTSYFPPRRAGVIRHSYFLTGHHFPAWFPLSITTSLIRTSYFVNRTSSFVLRHSSFVLPHTPHSYRQKKSGR